MLATELQSLDDQTLIETIALEAGKIALKHFKKEPEVWYKGISKSPVSEADLEIEVDTHPYATVSGSNV